MQRILMLGGSGFLGRWISRALLMRGYEVVDIDLAAAAGFRPPFSERYAFRRIDCHDARAIASQVRPGDVVFHLLHQSIPAESMGDPLAEREMNLDPYAELLDAFAKNPPAILAYSSSGGQVYGEAERLPVSENHPLNPITEYGKAKKRMEELTREASDAFGTGHLILRFGNPYGPFQEMTNRHGIVPRLMRAAIRKDPVTLFGGGATVRDYIHVEDAAEAVVDLLEMDVVNRSINIGSGIGTSLARLVELTEEITGEKVPAENAPIRPSDIHANVLDIRKLRDLTGYEPLISLREGLARTYLHMRKHEKI